MQLSEKYRPTDWDQFIGQGKVVKRVRAILDRPGFGDGAGEALWISGPTGTGKTTLAQLVARQLGVTPGPAWNYTELDGDKCNVATVRALDERTRAASMFDDWQVFIINEAHAMQGQAVNAWLTLLERLPARWIIIFTTTQKPDSDLFGDFTSPLLSRCKVFEFSSQGLAQAFAGRAREIADAEGLNGRPVHQYVRKVQDKKNNFRAVLQAIDAGEMLE